MARLTIITGILPLTLILMVVAAALAVVIAQKKILPKLLEESARTEILPPRKLRQLRNASAM